MIADAGDYPSSTRSASMVTVGASEAQLAAARDMLPESVRVALVAAR